MGSRVITVAQDGAADYRTVQEAIDAVPLGNACRTVIRVAPGVYRQPIYVPKTKNHITFAGASPETTVLTWHNTATSIEHHQAARVIGTGTFGCGTAIVEGEDFIAENITFENSAPQGSGQAVALRATADRCAFYNCRFLGWQDTLYLHHGKQYLSALAAAPVSIGWPCQRLNWGWRNVWTTCSINSIVPDNANNDAAATAGTGYSTTFFRRANGVVAGTEPTIVLATSGVYTPATPAGGAAAMPKFLCDNAKATGSGITSALRNRCRRAVDSYAALVSACQRPTATAGNRGPSQSSPDFAPDAGHVPHTTNVRNLVQSTALCALNPNVQQAPANLGTPSTTCPGLMGWFTVVFNACGFTNAPGFAGLPNMPSQPGQAPNMVTYFPVGVPVDATTVHVNTKTTGVVDPTLFGAAVSPSTGAGYFCSTPVVSGGGTYTPNGVGPGRWNANGPTFRTSRCRKALDQFGRTAQRCHMSNAPTVAGPAQAGGYSDPLRLLAVGPSATASGPVAPSGMSAWTPACNA